jgi:hypothetical protein
MFQHWINDLCRDDRGYELPRLSRYTYQLMFWAITGVKPRHGFDRDTGRKLWLKTLFNR